MTLTKNDMARVIATALYNAPELLPADNHMVIKLSRKKKNELAGHHALAVKVLAMREAGINIDMIT